MKKELAKLLCDILNEENFEVKMKDYSGRSMYGRTTTAISGDFTIADIIRIVIISADYFVDNDKTPLFEDLEDLRQDQLGLRTILY